MTRTGAHAALYMMFGSSLFFGSVCHGLMLASWFQHLKATASNLWCWKKRPGRILDLETCENSSNFEVEVQQEVIVEPARIE